MKRPRRNKEKVIAVFWPHGNLALIADHLGQERKLSSRREKPLSDIIKDQWNLGENTPLFVSEGSSKQKMASIEHSEYLRCVYHDQLSTKCENLCIFGWSFGEEDKHILEAIKKSNPRKIAVSVWTGSDEEEAHGYMVRTKKILKDFRIVSEVSFFDACEPGVWCNPRPEDRKDKSTKRGGFIKIS